MIITYYMEWHFAAFFKKYRVVGAAGAKLLGAKRPNFAEF